jgi:transposase
MMQWTSRAITAGASTTQPAIRGTQADPRSRSTDRHRVRAALGHCVEPAAARDGLRFGNGVLAATRSVAKGGRVATHPRNPAGRDAPSRPTRYVACPSRQLFSSRRDGGKKTGPNPTDRRKLGSKHHLITDAQGIPLAVILTAANCNDITQLDALVEAIPPIRGKPGRPLRKPEIVQGDRGYSSEKHRERLRKRGIVPQLAKIGSPHGSGLGKTRWPVERSFAWLHSFRRLKIRYERYAHIHEAFLSLACVLMCWSQLALFFD